MTLGHSDSSASSAFQTMQTKKNAIFESGSETWLTPRRGMLCASGQSLDPNDGRVIVQSTPIAPKRACSSFILFSKAERANVKREHPGASPAMMFKLLGERWRAADADTKAKYAALHAENKAKIEAVVPLTPALTSEVLGQPSKFETSRRADDANQWCDGYSRPIPIEPESSEYPRLLWKIRV